MCFWILGAGTQEWRYIGQGSEGVNRREEAECLIRICFFSLFGIIAESEERSYSRNSSTGLGIRLGELDLEEQKEKGRTTISLPTFQTGVPCWLARHACWIGGWNKAPSGGGGLEGEDLWDLIEMGFGEATTGVLLQSWELD